MELLETGGRLLPPPPPDVWLLPELVGLPSSSFSDPVMDGVRDFICRLGLPSSHWFTYGHSRAASVSEEGETSIFKGSDALDERIARSRDSHGTTLVSEID